MIQHKVPPPDAIEVIWQLFRDGPTCDGNICSKNGRGHLFDLGYAHRINGWSYLTADGMEFAVRVLEFGDQKERWENSKRKAA